MSSTRGGIDPTNLYTTPAWAVDAVLPHLPLAGTIVDAGCGEGAILARVAERVLERPSLLPVRLLGVELDYERACRAQLRLDQILIGATIKVTDWLTWEEGDISLAVFNPPFGPAQAFIEHAIKLTKRNNGTVAALLRASWSIPECRAEFAKANPFDLGVLRRRPNFAASLKCKIKTCGWRVIQPLDAPRAKACPMCAGRVSVVTNDSSEYGWHIWGPGRGGRLFALDIPDQTASADIVGVANAQ